MEANQITKQVLDFQKVTLSNWFDVMSILQDQADLTVDTVLKQASWMPDEGYQAILDWVSVCKNESDRYKTYVEESFSGLQKHIVQEIMATPVKAKQPTDEVKAASAKPKKPAAEAKKAPSVQKTK